MFHNLETLYWFFKGHTVLGNLIDLKKMLYCCSSIVFSPLSILTIVFGLCVVNEKVYFQFYFPFRCKTCQQTDMIYNTIFMMSKQKLKLLILNCHHNESVEKESWLYLFQSSENFRRWNSKMENKMCYFPQDKNLSFFKHYSQVRCM